MTGMDDEATERPSKSARKRESQELQELGEELIGLPDSVFEAVELPENLRDAILAARRITSHGGLLRQRQYIGRLMRTIDAAPIRAVIDQHLNRQRSSGLRFRQVEAWRDRLVSEGASAVPALRTVAATVEPAEIMRLLDTVQRAHDDQTRRTAARALFRYLDRKWGYS